MSTLARKLEDFQHFDSSYDAFEQPRLMVGILSDQQNVDAEPRYNIPRHENSPLQAFSIVKNTLQAESMSNINSFHLMDQFDSIPYIVWLKLMIIFQYMVGNSVLMRVGYGGMSSEKEFGDLERQKYSRYLSRFVSSYGLFASDKDITSVSIVQRVSGIDHGEVSVGEMMVKFNNRFIHAVESVVTKALKNLTPGSLETLDVTRGIRSTNAYDYYMRNISHTMSVNSTRDVLNRLNDSNSDIFEHLTRSNTYLMEMDKVFASLLVNFIDVFQGLKSNGRHFVMKYSLDNGTTPTRSLTPVSEGNDNLASFLSKVDLKEFLGTFNPPDEETNPETTPEVIKEVDDEDELTYLWKTATGGLMSVTSAMISIPGKAFSAGSSLLPSYTKYTKRRDFLKDLNDENKVHLLDVMAIFAGGGNREYMSQIVNRAEDYGHVETPDLTNGLSSKTYLKAVLLGESQSIPTWFIEDGVVFWFVPFSSSLSKYIHMGGTDSIVEDATVQSSLEAFKQYNLDFQSMKALIPPMMKAFANEDVRSVLVSCLGIFIRGSGAEGNDEDEDVHSSDTAELLPSYTRLISCSQKNVGRRQRRKYVAQNIKAKLGKITEPSRAKSAMLPGMPVELTLDLDWAPIMPGNSFKSLTHAAHQFMAAVITRLEPSLCKVPVDVSDKQMIINKCVSTYFRKDRVGIFLGSSPQNETILDVMLAQGGHVGPETNMSYVMEGGEVELLLQFLS